MINDAYKANFKTLLRAAKAGDLVLLECVDAKDGKPVMVACAVNAADGGKVQVVPLAKLFDGNAYEEVLPKDAGADPECKYH